jgi:hypothetical protein
MLVFSTSSQSRHNAGIERRWPWKLCAAARDRSPPGRHRSSLPRPHGPLPADSLEGVRSVGAVECYQFTAGNGCEGPQPSRPFPTNEVVEGRPDPSAPQPTATYERCSSMICCACLRRASYICRNSSSVAKSSRRASARSSSFREGSCDTELSE